MTFVRIAALAIAASACIGLAAAQPPVEAFANLPFMTEPQLSSDGRHIAAVQSIEGKPVAVIYQVHAPAGARPQILDIDGWPVVSVRWLKNDRVMAIVKGNDAPAWMGQENYTFYRGVSLAVDDTGWKMLPSTGVVDNNPDDPDTVFMPLYGERFGLYRVNVRTGDGTLEQGGGEGTRQWILDGTGHTVGRIDVTRHPEIDHLLLYKNDSFREVQEFPAGMDSKFHIHGVTLDGASLAYTARDASGHVVLQRFDLAGERAGDTLFADPRYAADLGTMRPYPYKARDGLDIPAYLTLPPGKASAKGLPLVVMPHGGPDARDGIGFDWWAQFLANRGYAVFQPNYRGSSGYGLAFTQAGLHQWGLKMQDDITDGVKALIADGTADPKRICIVGASYGGYAALAGATFTLDLYACAASISGVSNLGKMILREKITTGRRSDAVAFWNARIGDDSTQQDAASPALHAENVRVPVLLMHGNRDTTVSYSQSEMERDALLAAGKKVEFVTFDKDDHYMTLAETRRQMLTALERFLAQNIGPLSHP